MLEMGKKGEKGLKQSACVQREKAMPFGRKAGKEFSKTGRRRKSRSNTRGKRTWHCSIRNGKQKE